MGDAEVVASIEAGDPAGLAEAYDKYADPLYAYCWFMLDDPAGAGEAVQGTFVVADARLGRLRDPEHLRSWLYAVARNECLRQLKVRQGTCASGPSAIGPSPADRLFPPEREAMELQLAHGLGLADIALVLGIPRNRAQALLSRAADQLRARLSVPPGMTPAAVIAGMMAASTPRVGGAPAALRDHVLQMALRHEEDLLPYRADADNPAGEFRRNGFPKPLPMSRTRRQWLRQARMVLASGVVVAVVAGVFTITLVDNRQQPLTADPSSVRISATRPAGDGAGTQPTPSSTPGAASGRPKPKPHVAATRAPKSPSPSPTRSPAHATTSPSARPSVSPTTLAPSPTGTPSPTNSPSPSPSPSVVPGTLEVSTSQLDLTPFNPSGTITLTAVNGPVTWSISDTSGELALSQTGGSLAEGESVEVTVTAGFGTGFTDDLIVNPGGETITVVYRGFRQG